MVIIGIIICISVVALIVKLEILTMDLDMAHNRIDNLLNRVNGMCYKDDEEGEDYDEITCPLCLKWVVDCKCLESQFYEYSDDSFVSDDSMTDISTPLTNDSTGTVRDVFNNTQFEEALKVSIVGNEIIIPSGTILIRSITQSEK